MSDSWQTGNVDLCEIITHVDFHEELYLAIQDAPVVDMMPLVEKTLTDVELWTVVPRIAFASRGYLLTTDTLCILRWLLPPIRMKWTDISDVSLVDGKTLFRHASQGGHRIRCWGYYGRFEGRYTLPAEFKFFQAYVTNTGPPVVLRRKNTRPLVLSPVDVAGFMQAVRMRMESAICRQATR